MGKLFSHAAFHLGLHYLPKFTDIQNIVVGTGVLFVWFYAKKKIQSLSKHD